METRDDPTVTDVGQILHPADHPTLTVYSWERDGEFFSLYPGDPGAAPYDAAKILVRMYPFPEAAVREIYLDARTRTHHHIAYEDILFYQISGRRVQIVNERSREVNPGDVSLQVAGLWKRVDQIIPGVFLEFSIERPDKPGAEATWVAADEVPSVEVAGSGARPHHLKTFDLQGYAFFEARLPQGAVMEARFGDATLFYVVSGAVDARLGEVAGRAEAGAAMRAPAETPFRLEATEDAVIVYAPIPARRPE